MTKLEFLRAIAGAPDDTEVTVGNFFDSVKDAGFAPVFMNGKAKNVIYILEESEPMTERVEA